MPDQVIKSGTIKLQGVWAEGEHSPGSERSPMSADQTTFLSLSWTRLDRYCHILVLWKTFFPPIEFMVDSSDRPQCKRPTSFCTELIQLLSELLPFHYNAIAHYTTQSLKHFANEILWTSPWSLGLDYFIREYSWISEPPLNDFLSLKRESKSIKVEISFLISGWV